MELKDIVTSLEVSRDLEDKGFKLNTCFWWKVGKASFTKNIQHVIITNPYLRDRSGNFEYINCYNFSQLLNELPGNIHQESDSLTLEMGKSYIRYATYRETVLYLDLETNWSDLAASAILWCIENGHLKLENKADG